MSIWHFAENQFENATGSSRKRMNILIEDHIAKLKAELSDPDIAFLYERTLPVEQEWVNQYTGWKTAKGLYKGETNRFEELLEKLRTEKSPDWDNQIKVAVTEGSSDYVAIMPRGREPFYKGGRDERVAEVKALAKRLEGYPTLGAVMDDVNAFFTQINNSRLQQQQKEELVDKASDELEAQRIITAQMMYANTGRLIDKFSETPESIERFFELQVIRRTGSEEEEVEPIPPGDDELPAPVE